MADRMPGLTKEDFIEILLLAQQCGISEDELDLFHLWPYPELWCQWGEGKRTLFMLDNLPVVLAGRRFLRAFYRSRNESDAFSPTLRNELRRGEGNVAYQKQVEREVNDKLNAAALALEEKKARVREEVERMPWPEEI